MHIIFVLRGNNMPYVKKKKISFLNSLLDNVSTVDGCVQLGVKPCRTAEVMACAVSSYTF